MLQAAGKDIVQTCKVVRVSDKSYYRWRKVYGGLKSDQAWRFKERENENARLKQLVAELSLEKAVLKVVASGNF